MRQSLEVSSRCRNDKTILKCDTPLTYLVRVPSKGENGELTWEDCYLTAQFEENQYASFHINDEVKIRRLKSVKTRTKIFMEIDTFYTPAPVRERGRPYYPKICVIMDHNSGTALSFRLFKDIKKEGHKCIDMLIDCIEKSSLVPAKILVSGDEAYYLFVDICRQLGIQLEKVDRLEFAEQAKLGMFGLYNKH